MSIRYDNVQFWTYHDIAVIFAERERIQDLLNVVSWLEPEPFLRQDYVLRNVAVQLAMGSKFAEALEMAQWIRHQLGQSQAIYEITKQLAESGGIPLLSDSGI